MKKLWFCKKCWRALDAFEVQNFGRAHRKCGGQTELLLNEDKNVESAEETWPETRIRNPKGSY